MDRPDGTFYAIEWLRQVAEGINGGEDCLAVNAPLIVAEIERLTAIVEKLPKTADGTPIVPGMAVYCPGHSEMTVADFNDWGESDEDELWVHAWNDFGMALQATRCYSTREAAEAAKEGK